MNLLPPLPENPEERQAFIKTFHRELYQYRRRPGFIIGFVLAGASGIALAFYSSDNFTRLAVVLGLAGASIMHDTITRHFTTVIYHLERPQRADSPTSPPLPAESSPTVPASS